MQPEEPRERSYTFLGMTTIIASEPMHHLMGLVERIARSTATALITGESGVGKEAVARAIHSYSPRGHKPWVDLSCAALPEHLLESELFGQERGAFSGADTAKPGLFELAHQGTIFLDEVGELDPRMQVKLLRVLDGVPYYRLGGTRKVFSDVRIVAATNQDLERAVAEGRFRADLYHRLSQCTLWVPPLRARIPDIEPLARYFLIQHDASMRLSRSALDALEAHPWPGNIRELRNTVLQAGVLARSPELREYDFRLKTQSISPITPTHAHGNCSDMTGSLDLMERRMIQEALNATGGHQQKAATRLGISRRTLSRKLRGYDSEQARAAP